MDTIEKTEANLHCIKLEIPYLFMKAIQNEIKWIDTSFFW